MGLQFLHQFLVHFQKWFLGFLVKVQHQLRDLLQLFGLLVVYLVVEFLPFDDTQLAIPLLLLSLFCCLLEGGLLQQLSNILSSFAGRVILAIAVGAFLDAFAFFPTIERSYILLILVLQSLS